MVVAQTSLHKATLTTSYLNSSNNRHILTLMKVLFSSANYIILKKIRENVHSTFQVNLNIYTRKKDDSR